MLKMRRYCIEFMLLMVVLFYSLAVAADAVAQIKISVFNFGTLNMEASGYGTTVTNLLINSLKSDPALAMLDRKELEAFLNLNDLQQDDKIENAILIGTRLGLDVIVVGNVEKKGAVIFITCKVIMVEQKKIALNARAGALGDAGLAAEIANLTAQIRATIAANASTSVEDDKLKGPLNVRKRPGNKQVYLSWEDPPDTPAAGYEVFRSRTDKGPFTRIAQVSQREYADQDVERGATYHYKIRAYNNRGRQSLFSDVIAAETALTPNPPMIIRAQGQIRGIQLTWSPSPMPSDDPSKIKGYKLYRARQEQGPYREVASLSDRDLGLPGDAEILDKLFKVVYVDRNLEDGGDYYYRLTAYNEKNMESGFCSIIKGTTLPVVGGLSVRGDMIREVRLKWDAIDSRFVKGYAIYRHTQETGDFSRIKKIDSGSLERDADKKFLYSDSEGLGDNLRYYYRIAAFGPDDDETSLSATVSAVTKGKPPVPTGLKAKGGLVKKVELMWTANPQDDVEGYKIFWSSAPTGKFTLLKSLDGRQLAQYLDEARGWEKLGDGATYCYTILTFNRVGVESDLSEVVSAVTKPRPLKPVGLKGESFKVKSVPLAWQANREPDIVRYLIYRKNPSSGQTDFSLAGKTPDAATQYVDKDLKDGVTYAYIIRAEDKEGLISDFSEEVSLKTKARPKPPEELTGHYAGGMAQLKWKAGPESDLAHYRVYEKTFWAMESISDAEKVASTGVNLKVVLDKGKKKNYVVTSVDRDGLESDFSQEITVTGP
jgi:uncharacterized protein